jgi:uncharacterized protein YbjQ (UPF0145 family)
MKKLLILTFVAVALVSTSCTNSQKLINTVGFFPIQIQLQPNQYEIIGDTEGTGKAKYVRSPFDGIRTAITGRSVGAYQRALELAHFEAISKSRGADALIAPRYETKTRNIPLLIVTLERAEVTVYAKAIRLIPTKN